MIQSHQGYQSLNIREIPSFQQHEANQKQISNTQYKEDWNEEKDAIYFPAHVTDAYESGQKAQDAISDSKYRKDAEKKMHDANTFNMADSEQYQKSKEMSALTSDKGYKETWDNEKGNFSNIPITREMEKSKEMSNLRVSKFFHYLATHERVVQMELVIVFLCFLECF